MKTNSELMKGGRIIIISFKENLNTKNKLENITFEPLLKERRKLFPYHLKIGNG